jgi:sugar phosphate isomerase/epimerase
MSAGCSTAGTDRPPVTLPLGVQLYTFRDPARFGGAGMGLDVSTLTAIAAAGYLGVETVDVPGGDAAAARQVLADLDLAITSSHTWADVADTDSVARAAEALAELGSTRMIVSNEPVTTVAEVDALADRLAAAAEVAAGNGLRFGYHNHDTELHAVDGTPVIDRLVARLGASIELQVDLFWVAVGGAIPSSVVDRLGERIVSLHVKDGVELPATAYGAGPFVNVPAFEGVVELEPAIVAAERRPSIEWLIVEFDHVAGAPIDAVRRSHDHLVERGLARGRGS